MAESKIDSDKSKKRTLKNFFLTSKLSNNYHRKLIYISFILMSAINLYFINQMTLLNNKIVTLGAENQESISEVVMMIKKVILISTSGFVVYFLLMVGFIYLIQYRVAGPTKAILTFIQELKNNNLSYNRPLRTGDELGVIMDALVDLQQEMKKNPKNS